jgi:hypothetical protein
MSRYISWAQINTSHEIAEISKDDVAAEQIIEPDPAIASLSTLSSPVSSLCDACLRRA